MNSYYGVDAQNPCSVFWPWNIEDKLSLYIYICIYIYIYIQHVFTNCDYTLVQWLLVEVFDTLWGKSREHVTTDHLNGCRFLFSSKHSIHISNKPQEDGFVWKCWVNLPNEIAIFHRDNDQQNHWVQWGFSLFSDTPIYIFPYIPIENGHL